MIGPHLLEIICATIDISSSKFYSWEDILKILVCAKKVESQKLFFLFDLLLHEQKVRNHIHAIIYITLTLFHTISQKIRKNIGQKTRKSKMYPFTNFVLFVLSALKIMKDIQNLIPWNWLISISRDIFDLYCACPQQILIFRLIFIFFVLSYRHMWSLLRQKKEGKVIPEGKIPWGKCLI